MSYEFSIFSSKKNILKSTNYSNVIWAFSPRYFYNQGFYFVLLMNKYTYSPISLWNIKKKITYEIAFQIYFSQKEIFDWPND
jgi:hypothetical protein